MGRKENEAGGLYAQGVIAETYPAGTEYIPVTVKLTTHHKGFFEFRICPHNRPNVPVTQECLDRNLLHIKEGDEKSGYTRYYPEKHQGIDIYNLHLEIPAGMRCSQCVLNWRYKTGIYEIFISFAAARDNLVSLKVELGFVFVFL